jgi:peroxiredoxin
VDTWRNGDAEQGVNISGIAGGADMGQLAFTNGVILEDNSRKTGSVEIRWDPSKGATFHTTGLTTNADFTDVDTGAFVADDGHNFIISARVGGANEDLFIDNLIITAGKPGPGDPIDGNDINRVARLRANQGEIAANWKLPDRDGNVRSLEQFRGKPLVMIFYLGQECLVCLEQLGAIKAAHTSFEGSGVNLVAVSPDSVEDLANAQEYPFALLSDEDRSVAGIFGASDADGEPTHAVVIIDSEGKIIHCQISDLPEMNLGRILATAQGK